MPDRAAGLGYIVFPDHVTAEHTGFDHARDKLHIGMQFGPYSNLAPGRRSLKSVSSYAVARSPIACCRMVTHPEVFAFRLLGYHMELVKSQIARNHSLNGMRTPHALAECPICLFQQDEEPGTQRSDAFHDPRNAYYTELSVYLRPAPKRQD